MAITYLSGERIQGSSTSTRIITDDLASDKASWADSSTTGNGWEDSTNDAVDFKMISTDDDNTDHGYVYTDLQNTNYLDGDNIDETAFTVKCHVRFSALANTTSGENRAYFGFFSSTAWGGTAQDFFALQLAVKQNQDPEFVLGYGNNSTFESAPNKNGTAFTAEAEVATDYYITFTKTGGTTYKIRVTTEDDYEDGQEMTATVSNITSLRYFGWKGRGDGQNNGGNTQGYFNDISITSGTTDEKATITNIPVGTRYEETDTRKIFRRKAGGGLPQDTNIWGSDYTWTVAGGAAVTTGDDPTGLIHLTQSGGSGNQEYGHTTLTSSANTKTFDFNFTFVRHVGDKANNNAVIFGSDNWTPTPSGGNNGTHAYGTNKRIMMEMSNGSSLNLAVEEGDGSTGEGSANASNGDMAIQGCSSCTESTETTRYYKILGNGTNVICHRWTSAALRTAWEANNSANTPESSSAAVNFTTNWLSRDAIDTVSMGGSSGYHTGNWTVKEISVKFDSGAADSWVEKGTA